MNDRKNVRPSGDAGGAGRPAGSVARTESVDGLVLPLAGLGAWNLYFLAKFGLAATGYMQVSLLWNALLIAALLVPLRPPVLKLLRGGAALVAAVALAWSESWLPGPESLRANAGGITGFSTDYMLELALDFVNWQMVGGAVLGILLYVLLRDTVRITFITLCWFACLVATPVLEHFSTADDTPQEGVVETAETAGTGGPESAKAVADWYSTFIDYEKARRAELPAALDEKDTPFDILVLNVCSLSNDDLAAAELDDHPVLGRFNIRFDRFNSATSYSGPAALRLLTGACGQPAHEAIYGERRPECETLNRLSALGFSQHVMMDHSGEYDDFLKTLRERAGLAAPLESAGRAIPVRYMGFDDEEILDTLGLLRFWQRTTARAKERRSVTFMNLIALHDGNRLPRHGRSEPFRPRAAKLLDDLGVFMRELERSGRRVMLVLVPEHGAAVRGDRIQGPRLRDIPTPAVTQVPVMVKFFGIRGLSAEPLHVTAPTSYLGLTSLIGRTLSRNYFSKRGGSVPLEELVRDLPETNLVSENASARVLRLKGADYWRRGDGEWRPYGK